MLFNSPSFLFLFLPISFFAYQLLRMSGKRSLLVTWLLACSLFFYAYWNPPYAILLIATIVANFYIGKQIANHRKREGNSNTANYILGIGIVLNCIPLAYYKYAHFLLDILDLNHRWKFESSSLVLPLAISFYTFQQIAYLVDTYRTTKADAKLLEYSLFVSFFPQLIAGPIVRIKDILPQLRTIHINRADISNLSRGLALISIGLSKKAILADSLSIIVDAGYNTIPNQSGLDAWICAIAFAFQIYYDFSGYTDIARGVALLFNIELPRNFDSPYTATSIDQFWKRWHMTLSHWLLNYVYLPLGGNRIKPIRTYTNILVVFMLSGLWHGAGWTFVAWGTIHGIAVIANKCWNKTNIILPKPISWSATFLFLCVTWVFFRSPDIQSALSFIQSMFTTELCEFSQTFLDELAKRSEYLICAGIPTFNTSRLIPLEIFIIIPLLSLFFPNSDKLSNAIAIPDSNNMLKLILASITVGSLIGLSTSYILGSQGDTFIYFNF